MNTAQDIRAKRKVGLWLLVCGVLLLGGGLLAGFTPKSGEYGSCGVPFHHNDLDFLDAAFCEGTVRMWRTVAWLCIGVGVVALLIAAGMLISAVGGPAEQRAAAPWPPGPRQALPVAPSAGTAPEGMARELAELARLRDIGVLSDAEFAAAKARVIGSAD